MRPPRAQKFYIRCEATKSSPQPAIAYVDVESDGVSLPADFYSGKFEIRNLQGGGVAKGNLPTAPKVVFQMLPATAAANSSTIFVKEFGYAFSITCVDSSGKSYAPFWEGVKATTVILPLRTPGSRNFVPAGVDKYGRPTPMLPVDPNRE
jgi:hypothetical protein